MGNNQHFIIFAFMLLAFFSCSKNNNGESKSSNQKEETVNFKPGNSKFEDTLINNQEYLIIGPENSRVEIYKKNKIPNHLISYELTDFAGDYFFNREYPNNCFKIFRKYSTKSNFNDFKVAMYTGKLAEPDFTNNPKALRFKTRIKETCKKGINFAGHYTIVSYGCGTSCESYKIVDRINGKIINLPTFGASASIEFQKDSKMVIHNVGWINANLIREAIHAEVKHFQWDGNDFIEIE